VNSQAPPPAAALAYIKRNTVMLYWAAVFFVIALVAAVFGFGGLAAGAGRDRENLVLHLLGHFHRHGDFWADSTR
jgi:hypothetical protein